MLYFYFYNYSVIIVINVDNLYHKINLVLQLYIIN